MFCVSCANNAGTATIDSRMAFRGKSTTTLQTELVMTLQFVGVVYVCIYTRLQNITSFHESRPFTLRYSMRELRLRHLHRELGLSPSLGSPQPLSS